MKVEFHRNFLKVLNKRFGSSSVLGRQFEERARMFELNPKDSRLKDHPLKGTKAGLRAFSVTGDIRVIYRVEDNVAYFIDIGTHNQVYN